MNRRGLFGAALIGLLLIGCAQPGAGDGSTEVLESPSPTNSPSAKSSPVPRPSYADCYDTAARGGVSRGPTGQPVPTGSGPGDDFQRNRQANNAFRDRIELPPETYAAAQPCVTLVEAALAKLGAAGRYDEASVVKALRSAGLTSAYARKPGRLDLGSGTGVVFTASPGVGCIVGHHGPDSTTVEFGGATRDGGCLVAAD